MMGYADFSVETRRNRTKVVLTSGKVKLNTKGFVNDELYMDPKELAEVSGEHNKLIKKL